MNIDRWIAVAAIIISLLGAGWQVRTARQIANPDRKPPKIFRTAIAKIIGAVKEYGSLAVAMAIPVLSIGWEVFRPGEVSDSSLIFIVFNTVVLSVEISAFITILIVTRPLGRSADKPKDEPKND